jgi:hypothetical protein
MKRLLRRAWLLAAAAALLGLGGLVVLACSNGDDDDDDEPSYGLDLEGMYQVTVRTTYNSCPDGELDEAQWFLSIEQNKDYSRADVYWQEEGAGTEKNKLFSGDVYGTLIIRNDVRKTPLGEEKCIQLEIEYYRLNVDPDNATVNGWLIDDIVYVGSNCSPSTVDCRTERMIESNPVDGGDDDAADDDTADDDDTTSA